MGDWSSAWCSSDLIGAKAGSMAGETCVPWAGLLVAKREGTLAAKMAGCWAERKAATRVGSRAG